MSRKIELSQGFHAVVDDEDYGYLSKFKWYARKTKTAIYAVRNEGGTTIQMHRTILNATKEYKVDHKNLDGLDNRKENLRLCTRSQNGMNVRKSSGDHSSSYKGVCLNKQTAGHSKCWRAEIRINGKPIFLGYFYNEKDAAIAYNDAAMKYFGEFAKLNEVENA